MTASASAPTLRAGVRLGRNANGGAVLLVPEGVVNLNPSAAAIMELLDGKRSAADIADVLAARHGEPAGKVRADTDELLQKFAEQMWVTLPSESAQ